MDRRYSGLNGRQIWMAAFMLAVTTASLLAQTAMPTAPAPV